MKKQLVKIVSSIVNGVTVYKNQPLYRFKYETGPDFSNINNVFKNKTSTLLSYEQLFGFIGDILCITVNAQNTGCDIWRITGCNYMIYDPSTSIITDDNLNSIATTPTVLYDTSNFKLSRFICGACNHGFKPQYNVTSGLIELCVPIPNCNLKTIKPLALN